MRDEFAIQTKPLITDFAFFRSKGRVLLPFSVLLQPICGVLHGLNRESGENPVQFPLLCWLQRLP